jgi:hypothetical protein
MKKIFKFLFSLHFSFFIFHSAFSQHPYYHQVYSATSLDGLNWIKQNVMLFDHASVPGSVIDTNGTIFLYFDYFASTSSIEQLMVATSTDGITFSAEQEVQINGSTVTRRVDPTALLLPDGRIRLFYIDFDATPYTKDVHSATSSDGINFTEDAGIRFTKEPITDPDVFCIGDSVWIMYVTYWGNVMELVKADSKDGLTFLEDTSFYFDAGAISGSMQYDTLFRTYYCSNGIESFVTDGKTITLESGTRIDGPVCDPTVLMFTDSTYIMYYKYIVDESQIEEMGKKDCISVSLNLIHDFVDITVNHKAFIGSSTFSIFNILGCEIASFPLNDSKTQLNCENFSSGIYYYTFQNKGEVISDGKLMIQ